MTSNSKQSFEKSIIHQDLKFSVEFENGESSEERKLVNTKYERNRSKDIALNDFKGNDTKGEYIKSQQKDRKGRDSKRVDDEDSNIGADVTNVKKARTDTTAHENVTEITIREEEARRKQTLHRTSFSSLRGSKYKPLPGIGDPEKGGPRQKWEKHGENGEIPIQARIRGPGPAHYLLPTTIGRGSVDLTRRHSPAFSFGSRSWSFRNESPGPAYNIDPLLGPKGKENRPSFSFGVKPKTPVRRFQTPGPGSYNTDSPPLWEKRAPQYSISPRTKQRPVDAVPGPNIYALPTLIGDKVPHQKAAPSITMAARSEKHSYAEDLAKTPGPAKYGPSPPSITKRRGPEYSVQGRVFFNGNQNTTPGPGAYNPQDVNSHLEQSPRHVIGVRHSEFVMPTLTPADCD